MNRASVGSELSFSCEQLSVVHSCQYDWPCMHSLNAHLWASLLVSLSIIDWLLMSFSFLSHSSNLPSMVGNWTLDSSCSLEFNLIVLTTVLKRRMSRERWSVKDMESRWDSDFQGTSLLDPLPSKVGWPWWGWGWKWSANKKVILFPPQLVVVFLFSMILECHFTALFFMLLLYLYVVL